jgi:TolB-like protein/Tfp pilus assembly protein PilF
MSDNSNNPINFWQELKRRKVLRVITVYAAVAFVILQLVEILAPSLRLPDWTMNFILVILIVGFIIAIILSWIYDIHPEGGIVKTEPAHKAKEEDVPKSSSIWKIASYISFVVIIGLIIINIIPRSGNREILDKSIAVLPFRNESSDQENTYFINGIMESVLDNLSKIEDLRVISRNSVEQYRNNPKPTPVVAEEMNVSYIIEGSGQKIGNRLLLTIQLVVGKDDYHIWSKQYDRNIQQIEDLIDIQQEIAQSIASEIEAIITSEEKQLIVKIPTTSQTAYDFYQRGLEEMNKYWRNQKNREAAERAEDLMRYALEYDSTFAKAYTNLANIYMQKYFWEYQQNEDYLDSVLVLTDKALSYDDQLSEAYRIRGNYYQRNNKKEQAINEYDSAIKFNPNNYAAYVGKGEAYASEDIIGSLENYHKAALLVHGSGSNWVLNSLGETYLDLGFKDKHQYYLKEVLKLNDDSISYYRGLIESELLDGNYPKAIEYGLKAYAIDSTNADILIFLGISFLYNKQFEQSLTYCEKYIENRKARNQVIFGRHWIGYAYWRNGYKLKGEHYVNEHIKYIEEIKKHYLKERWVYIDLASAFAAKGDKGQAYMNLRISNQAEGIDADNIITLRDDPMFDSIRNEAEFQQILKDTEAKYQAEHERVRKWLEENDLL